VLLVQNQPGGVIAVNLRSQQSLRKQVEVAWPSPTKHLSNFNGFWILGTFVARALPTS
jgi:hypothetical protein